MEKFNKFEKLEANELAQIKGGDKVVIENGDEYIVIEYGIKKPLPKVPKP